VSVAGRDNPDIRLIETTHGESHMSLVGVVLTLVVVGVLLWLLNNYVPMDSKIKSIVNVVVVIVVVVWLLQAFGVLGSLQNIRIR
jgi:hypothetical protein